MGACATRLELAFMPRKTLFPHDLAPLHPSGCWPFEAAHENDRRLQTESSHAEAANGLNNLPD